MSIGPGKGKIKNLVTLGTAHYGTRASSFLKFFMSGSLAKDLKTNSHFLKTLNNTVPPRGCRIVSIYSKNDWTAWPLSSCRLKEASRSFKNHIIDSTGHVGLCITRLSLILFMILCHRMPLKKWPDTLS